MVLNQINGREPNVLFINISEKVMPPIRALGNRVKNTEQVIADSVLFLNKSSNILLYLEEDEYLKINLQYVQKVKSSMFGKITRLDFYSEKPGNYCGLSTQCFCRVQNTVEIENLNGKLSNTVTTKNETSFIFGNPNFVLEIISSVISKNATCSRDLNEKEGTKVYWLDKNGMTQDTEIDLEGFVSDAKIFYIESNLY